MAQLEKKIELAKKKNIELQLPMIPVEFRDGLEVEGVKFPPGWYAVSVTPYADQYVQKGQKAFENQRSCQIHCIAWNVGNLDITPSQCGRIMSLWDMPILEPAIFKIATNSPLWPLDKPLPKVF
jgi:hypothetical protein